MTQSDTTMREPDIKQEGESPLTEQEVREATEDIDRDYIDWTSGCSCDKRSGRRRVVADRTDVPPTHMEVWACFDCEGVYLRPDYNVDYDTAGDIDKDPMPAPEL